MPFPFSDLSRAKLRPALVLVGVDRDDWILCQITSNAYADVLAIELIAADFQIGALRKVSYARPGKLFRANQELMVAEVGTLKDAAFRRVIAAIRDLFNGALR